jgi:hypothetical protein
MDMTRVVVLSVFAAAAFGCAPKSDNPLLDATDAQFKQSASWYFECLVDYEKSAVAFADSTIKRDKDRELKVCLEGTQKRAASAGIAGNVSFDHIQDARVKDRYQALKAEPAR